MAITRLKTFSSTYDLWSDDDGGWGFGTAILFDEARGNIIISHPWIWHDFGAGGVTDAGKVVVLSVSTGALVQEIFAPYAQEQSTTYGVRPYFGHGMALSGDWLAIGHPHGNVGIGGVTMFQWNGSQFVPKQRLQPAAATLGKACGQAVGLSGSLLAIGEPEVVSGVGRGRFYIFRESGGTWTEDAFGQTDAPDTDSGQYFASRIVVAGSRIAVTSPNLDYTKAEQGAAYVYDDAGIGSPPVLRGSLYGPETDDHASFGCSLGFDGNYLVAGAPYYSDGHIDDGLVQVFKRTGDAWGFLQTVNLPVASNGNSSFFGSGWETGTVQGSVDLKNGWIIACAYGWAEGAYHMSGAGFILQLDTGTGLFAPVQVEGGVYPITVPDAGSYFYFGQSATIDSAGNTAIATVFETGDTDDGLYACCGTVRLYGEPEAGHPLYNRSFEDPGLDPGDADWWTEEVS